MRFVDTFIPFGADAARIREGLDDMERRRIQTPTFQINDGTSTFGVYDYLKLVNAGTLTASGNVVTLTQTVVSSGTYTPSLTNGANVAGSTARECFYTRVGNNVHVAGTFLVDPTAALAATVLDISLPIASNLAQTYQLSGGAINGVPQPADTGEIAGSVANDRAIVTMYPASALNQTFQFWFDYMVI
jgi:hypothetical protein